MNLPTYREAVFAKIGSAHQNSGFGIHQDALITAESINGTDDGVAALPQFIFNAGCKAGFQSQALKRVSEASGFSRLLSIHAEIDNIDQHLRMTLRLHVTAHHAKRKKWFSVFQNQRRDECVERSLSWFDTIRMLRIQFKQRTPVVQDNSCIARNQAGTKISEDAVDKGNDVLVPVHDRQVDGFAILWYSRFNGRESPL